MKQLTIGELLKEQGERLRLELLSGEKSREKRILVRAASADPG